jgi:hypothetical protein
MYPLGDWRSSFSSQPESTLFTNDSNSLRKASASARRSGLRDLTESQIRPKFDGGWISSLRITPRKDSSILSLILKALICSSFSHSPNSTPIRFPSQSAQRMSGGLSPSFHSTCRPAKSGRMLWKASKMSSSFDLRSSSRRSSISLSPCSNNSL